MYDLPGLEAETDRLWAALRDALRAAGLNAPEALTRGEGAEAIWTAPDLLLSQTCGLPLVAGRTGRAEVLGAVDFGLPGCGPGQYNSVMIVPKASAVRGAGDLRAARFAFNATGSQSGFAALWHAHGPRLGPGVETGSHRASLHAVAAGDCDLAALDAVSWRLLAMTDGASSEVRVIGATPPTPGLPLITAPGRDVAALRSVVARGVAAYCAGGNRLGLRGFVPLTRADYEAAILPVD